ncbi:hypothetical protein JL697_02925 [Mycoplasmopsis bovis]|nr:hypothetical protein [Mycoplasmopsis bovis]MCA8841407.1 hypothetical protein [Mycoplasmopsis bovis]MCA8844551.1 hypothetical protein [Mycoplasmopsis bovis]MCA8848573.1 hypothetical protein [Mycoplasmopsis bovis]MCA8850124.1 hypothetical protein [Mycoplasmopsis bovis]MCA8853891.1 hypothetical protein [Mycoplasmopsis bovis]
MSLFGSDSFLSSSGFFGFSSLCLPETPLPLWLFESLFGSDSFLSSPGFFGFSSLCLPETPLPLWLFESLFEGFVGATGSVSVFSFFNSSNFLFSSLTACLNSSELFKVLSFSFDSSTSFFNSCLTLSLRLTFEFSSDSIFSICDCNSFFSLISSVLTGSLLSHEAATIGSAREVIIPPHRS